MYAGGAVGHSERWLWWLEWTRKEGAPPFFDPFPFVSRTGARDRRVPMRHRRNWRQGYARSAALVCTTKRVNWAAERPSAFLFRTITTTKHILLPTTTLLLAHYTLYYHAFFQQHLQSCHHRPRRWRKIHRRRTRLGRHRPTRFLLWRVL